MWISSQSEGTKKWHIVQKDLRGSRFHQLNCSTTLVNFRNEESCCLHGQPMWKIGRTFVQKVFP